MKVFVHCQLTDSLAEISISSNETVKSLKKKILNDFQYRIDQQRLVYNTVQLDDTLSLIDQYVEDESTIHLELTIPPSPQNYLHSYSAYFRTLSVHYNNKGNMQAVSNLQDVPITAYFDLLFFSSVHSKKIFLNCLTDMSEGSNKYYDMVEICGIIGAKQRLLTVYLRRLKLIICSLNSFTNSLMFSKGIRALDTSYRIFQSSSSRSQRHQPYRKNRPGKTVFEHLYPTV